MFSQESIVGLVDFITNHLAVFLLPVMITTFLVAIVLRVLVHYTVTRELWFAKEFHKRVHSFLDNLKGSTDNLSFYVCMKLMLEKTYYELFLERAYHQRRYSDYIMSHADRVFYLQEGSARLVKETLRQSKHLRYQKERPRFIEMVKNIFESNVCFKRVMGILPVQLTHDVLSILPGIFIIGGIFGTFLGIMAALPELKGMDLTDVEGAQMIMGDFLKNISFSMSTSVVGIILSVSMTFLNTLLDPEKVFIKAVNKVENSMELLWDCCATNNLPKDISGFNQHRDPIEALAENAVDKELRGKKGFEVKEGQSEEEPKQAGNVDPEGSHQASDIEDDIKKAG